MSAPLSMWESLADDIVAVERDRDHALTRVAQLEAELAEVKRDYAATISGLQALGGVKA